MAEETSPTTTPASPPSSAPTADLSLTPPEPAAEPKVEPTLLNETPPEPVGAPDKYADFSVPEGHRLDTEAANEFSQLAKGMNLSQRQAQSLVDFYVAKTSEAFAAPFEVYKAKQEEWIGQVKDHPEIKGKLDQVKATVSSALDSLGDAKLASDFRQAMDFTGAGNHPAFVRVFYKLAQMVTEGKAVAGAGPSPHGQNAGQAARPSIAQALYPTLPSG